MTPLAHYLASQLILRPSDRDDVWRENSDSLRASLYDIHCFETTAALPMLAEVGESLHRVGQDSAEEIIGKFVFLPAPKTWIEYINPVCGRIAYLLEENKQKTAARITLFWKEAAQNLGELSLISDDYRRPGGKMYLPKKLGDAYGEKVLDALISGAHLFLILINTPRIIGRRQIMPHVGLEKKLLKRFGAGSFPLHAWTEIKLEIAKPIEVDDGEPHEAHLTGRRALHFCRKHIRIRQGRLEYVSAHWRGDAALGIKRSRYSLTTAGARN